MKKILILTVGGSPDPVVNAIKQNKPEFVFFICSGGEGPASSWMTIENKTEEPPRTIECPYCKKRITQQRSFEPIIKRAELRAGSYEILKVDDPDDFRLVYNVCNGIPERLKYSFPNEELHVIANYTGGTKTMSAGLFLYALQQNPPWELQVNTTSRSDIIKINTGDFSQKQDVGFIMAKKAYDEANEFFYNQDYSRALDRIDFISRAIPVAQDFKKEMNFLRTKSALLSAWERFEHAEALSLAETVPSLKEKYSHKLKALIRSKTIFESDEPWNVKDKTGYELVRDVLQNAEACAKRKRFDDAFGRLYRATEILAQVHMRRVYNVNTSNVDLKSQKIPDTSKKWLENCSFSGGKIEIGLCKAFKLLAEIEDPLGKFFKQKEYDLKKYIEKRNYSIFAHGIKPVTEEIWKETGQSWKKWINEAIEIAEGV